MLKYVWRFAPRKLQGRSNSSDVKWLFQLKDSREMCLDTKLQEILMKCHFSLLEFSDLLLFLTVGMPVCLCVGMCTGVQMPVEALEEDIHIPLARVPGGSEYLHQEA